MKRHICINKGYDVVLCGREKPKAEPGRHRVWLSPITVREYRERQERRIDGPYCKQCVGRLSLPPREEGC